MTRERIGRFTLGIRSVELFVRGGSGAEFDSAPDGGIAEVTVGLSGQWPGVLGRFLHEIMELAFSDCCCRYSVCPDYANASDCYTFFANHQQFSEIIGRAGWAASEAVPMLSTAYRAFSSASKKKHRKPRKK